MSVSAETNGELYLDLLKKCLTRALFGERYRALVPLSAGRRTWQRGDSRRVWRWSRSRRRP
jgi:hypothetical protein